MTKAISSTMRRWKTRAVWAVLLSATTLACERDKVGPRSAGEPSGPKAGQAVPPGDPPPGPPPGPFAAGRLWVVGPASAPVFVGAAEGEVWMAGPDELGSAQPSRRFSGTGVVQMVRAYDGGSGPQAIVVWGRSRKALQAPLVVESISLASGARTELLRQAGERPDVAALVVADLEGDSRDDLLIAHFESKYMVRELTFFADGRKVSGELIRMATAWAAGDLDKDGKPEIAIGRMYGEPTAEQPTAPPGDLRLRGKGGVVPVPTDRGVRSVLIATLAGDAGPTLYFADGWSAAYAREGKAQVKRAVLGPRGVTVTTVGASADEYTFDALFAVDVDGDGRVELAAHGPKRITLFFPKAGSGPGPGSGPGKTSADAPNFRAVPLGIDPIEGGGVWLSGAGKARLFVPGGAPREIVLPSRVAAP